MGNIKMPSGFKPADGYVQPRIVAGLAAKEKCGKTHFALTAPGPIAFFNLDIGTEGVVGKFIEEKDVYECKYDPGAENPEAEWERFESDFDSVLRVEEIRTMVLDTATEVWELLRINKFGRLDQVMPHMYGPVNAVYRRLIRDAYKSGKNIVLIHKMKPEYIGNERTGGYVLAGFADTPFLTQVNVRLFRDDVDGGSEFSALVNDCRQNPGLNGEVLEGPMCSFPALAQAILPDSKEEDWY